MRENKQKVCNAYLVRDTSKEVIYVSGRYVRNVSSPSLDLLFCFEGIQIVWCTTCIVLCTRTDICLDLFVQMY